MEQLIQASLEKLAVGRTVIEIAHRLSTIVKADKVVVLEHGPMGEQGAIESCWRNGASGSIVKCSMKWAKPAKSIPCF